MNKSVELRREKSDAIAKMRDILDTCEDEGRSMTTAEEKEYQKLDSRVDQLTKEIMSLEANDLRRSKVSGLEAEGRKIINPFPTHLRDSSWTGEGLDDGGFRNIGEFLHSVAVLKSSGRSDPRLDKAFEKREQTMGTGKTGGFALPTQFDATVRQVSPQEAIVRPRATVIPPGNPPDAQLSFPALDQTSGQNMYGGVIITHTGEGVTMNETTANLREVTLEPKELSAYIVVTQKLLNNWEASGAWIGNILRQAMTGQEDYDFLRGDGINKALGVMNSGAAIAYTRAGNGAIGYADVYGMLARLLMRGPAVWVASQTIVPQLAAMVDAGNHAVWTGGGNLPGIAGPLPSTLFGIPVMFSERSPALGSKGDLMLLSPQHYMVKDGSGPIAASSEHVYFTSNKVVFKLVWNVDGRPWLTEPLALEGSTSNTVSPFVVLN